MEMQEQDSGQMNMREQSIQYFQIMHREQKETNGLLVRYFRIVIHKRCLDILKQMVPKIGGLTIVNYAYASVSNNQKG